MSGSWLNFVVSAISGVRITAIAWQTLPFLAWSLVVLFLIIVYPPLTTWLPSQIQ